MNVTVKHLHERLGPWRLGRHVEHDARSYAYAQPEHVGQAQSTLWKRHGDVFDQGSLGSCTGNAMAGALMTEPLYQPGRVLTEDDAVRIYELGTTLDNVPGHYPPDDTGSSGLAVAKAARQMGYISVYRHCFTVPSLIGALQHGPVIVGCHWYDGFNTPQGDAAELVISGEVVGGHEFLVRGIDIAAGMLLCDNSWSKSWGNNGSMCMTLGTWNVLRKQQGDCVVPVK